VSKDISSIMSDWPYEPGQISVRRVKGGDGRTKIQLRVDLGLLQMETDGRPDGQRPEGCDSYLAYFEELLERHRRTHGGEDGFGIDEKHCELLRAEAVQYYYRYLSEFVLEDYDAVVRDTARNLRVLDLCAKFAQEEADRYAMEQYRPYIIMMNSRARAQMLLKDKRPRAARKIIESALRSLKEYYTRFGQEDLYGSSSEVSALETLLKEIDEGIPPDPLDHLKRKLADAIEHERYEEAARLRDAIRAAAGDEQDAT